MDSTPKRDVIIAASVLASDFANLEKETSKVLEAGADWVHLDIMDGHFVPNISFGAPVVKCLRQHIKKGNGFFDCHLMIANPAQWLDDFEKAGADQITFHFEAVGSDCDKAIALARKITERGMKAGLSIKPKTTIDAVYPALDEGIFATLLVMTVEPGFGGQSFMADMMPKVSAARSRYSQLTIQVDGGLDNDTSKIAAAHGANAIVAGTYIFKAHDVSSVISSLRKVIQDNLIC